jgi:hypothetical protein
MKPKTRMWLLLSLLGLSTAALIGILVVPFKSFVISVDMPHATLNNSNTSTTVDTFWFAAFIVGVIFRGSRLDRAQDRPAPQLEHSAGRQVMPNLPVTYRTRPVKVVLLAFGSSVFVSIGLWLLPQQPFVALACIIFFGLCASVGLVGLLPNSSYLTLTEEGFLFASLFRKHFVSWSNVQSFAPVKIQLNCMVGWNYSPAFSESQCLRGINTAVAGVEAALPDTYGMPSEQLADLMNQLRDIHTRSVR